MQSSRGPIGCRVTMAVARIVMQVWSEKYRNILENSGVLIAMMKGYVDDNRQLSRMLAMGMRFKVETNRFEKSEEALAADIQAKEEGEHVDQRMARICRPAMVSVNLDLDFTVETAKDYKDGYLPCLDFKTKMTPRSTIIHTYFQKPMKTPFILMECSAMGEQQKHQILTNELIRRLSLVDVNNIENEEILKVVEQFIQEMKSSGYKRDRIREVVVGGIKGWKRKILRRKASGIEFYRTAKSTLKQRNYKKLMEKETWFKGKDTDKDDEFNDVKKDEGWRSRRTESKKGEKKNSKDTIKAVLTVPFTIGSGLAKEIREGEYNFEKLNGWRTKVVERTGRALQDILTTSNPWRGKDCERDLCLPCDTKERTGKDKTQDCSRRSVVYETWCLNCEKEEVDKIDALEDKNDKEKKDLKKKIVKQKYVGESARSLYERGFEHQHAMTQLRQDSHMLKHALDKHEDEDYTTIKFGIRAMVYCRSSFERQITEACKIQVERRHHEILNSRAEYNRSAVPRLMTKLGDREYKKYGEEMKEEKIREEIIEEKIARMRKERNKERKPQEQNKENKRRKLNKTEYEEKTTSNGRPEKKVEGEKRREEEEVVTQPKPKKMKQMKIGETVKPTPAEKPLDNTEPEDIEYTETEREMVSRFKNDPRFFNMEDINEKRKKAKDDLEKKLKERKEKAELKEKSWEMAKLCIEIIKENKGEWKTREKDQIEEKRIKEQEEEKIERQKKCRQEKDKWEEKRKQKRIDIMMEEINDKNKEEWNNLENEEARKERKELQELKSNVWNWRGKNRILRDDPREKLSLNKKIEILNNMLEKETREKAERIKKAELESKKWKTLREEKEKEKREKIEKKRNLEKSWETVRWISKMLQHDILNWKEIPDDSENWKTTGHKNHNSKKSSFLKKYKRIKNKIQTLGDVQEEEEPEVDGARRWRCDSVLARGGDDKMDDLGQEMMNLLVVPREEMEPDAESGDLIGQQDDRRMDVSSLETAEPDDAQPEMPYTGKEYGRDSNPEQYMMDVQKEEQELGYYVDMLRGLRDIDNKIMSIELLDEILDNIRYEITTPPSDQIDEMINKQTPPPTTPLVVKNTRIPKITNNIPSPILPNPGKLFCDPSNATMPVSIVGANLRYVDMNLSTGTALRNVDPLHWGSGLNKQVKSSGFQPTQPTPLPPTEKSRITMNLMQNFVTKLKSPQKMKNLQKITPNLQKITPKLQKVKSSAKILKEGKERKKFIEKFIKPEETKITLKNLILKSHLVESDQEKFNNTGKSGPDGVLNFKEKLSKFKFLEAGVLKASGQTECDKERGPPSKFATQTKKLSINPNVKVINIILTKNTDGTAADGILTNEKPEKFYEAGRE